MTLPGSSFTPLYYATIVELGTDHGLRYARVRVGGALVRVSVEVLPGVAVGDRVLVSAGAALARVAENPAGPEVA